jgi:predicted HicB family RNase H-like nuclease
MVKALSYKAHYGSVRYSVTEARFYGKVEAIAEPVTFEAPSSAQLSEAFEEAVDYYLEFCQVAGSVPHAQGSSG